jgi:hypothetical protein
MLRCHAIRPRPVAALAYRIGSTAPVSIPPSLPSRSIVDHHPASASFLIPIQPLRTGTSPTLFIPIHSYSSSSLLLRLHFLESLLPSARHSVGKALRHSSAARKPALPRHRPLIIASLDKPRRESGYWTQTWQNLRDNPHFYFFWRLLLTERYLLAGILWPSSSVH